MKMEHYLAAYDRDTDNFLSFISAVPDAYMPRVKEIAKVVHSDPDAVGSYQLDSSQVDAILKLLDKRVRPTSKMVIFLEPVQAD
jgi:hypothetical protein